MTLQMQKTLRQISKECVHAVSEMNRVNWLKSFPGMCTLSATQVSVNYLVDLVCQHESNPSVIRGFDWC